MPVPSHARSLQSPLTELQARIPVQLQVMSIKEVCGKEAGSRGAEGSQAHDGPPRQLQPVHAVQISLSQIQGYAPGRLVSKVQFRGVHG